jgi:hypothetical protein
MRLHPHPLGKYQIANLIKRVYYNKTIVKRCQGKKVRKVGFRVFRILISILGCAELISVNCPILIKS